MPETEWFQTEQEKISSRQSKTVSGLAEIFTKARTEKAPKPLCGPHGGVGSGSRMKAVALSPSGLMDDMGTGLSETTESEVVKKSETRHFGRDAGG